MRQDSLFYKNVLFFLLRRKGLKGRLEIIIKDKKYNFGNSIEVEGNSKYVNNVSIKILDKRFFRKLIHFGDVGLGEAYFLKYFEVNDLKSLLLWFVQNEDVIPSIRKKHYLDYFYEWFGAVHNIYHKFNKNTKKGSRKNIKRHYDISNDFYELWLDDTMTYSSAVFLKDSSLKQAQENKYKRICEKLKLKKEHSILEIGSGWGGFAIYAAENYGCKIKTVTISKNQYKYAKEKIELKGLKDRIDIKFEDYRNIKGKYDKIVSIEMMEAIGYEYVPKFIQKCNNLLKGNGEICLQFITYPDKYFKHYLKNPNFIKKHIFPGGELISLNQIKKCLQENSLTLISSDSIGNDYAKTLRIWDKNFLSKKLEIKRLGFDDRFIRMWHYYFIYCEVGFETYLDDLQILIKKERKENVETKVIN